MSLENPYFAHIDTKQTVSPLRKVAGPLLQKITEEFHEKLPDISANHITAASAVISVIGSLVAKDITTNTGKRNILALSLLGGGILLDGLDGTLARHIKTENPEQGDSGLGGIYDSSSDFIKDLSMNVIRIIQAHNRDDQLGETLAYATTVTNPLARFIYQNAVGKGYDIPEIGRDPLDFFGGHVGKPPTFAIATAYPEVNNVPVQNILDATTTVGNVYSMVMNTTQLPEEPTLNESARKTGYLRSRLHIFTSAATLAVAAGTYYALNKRDK